MSQEQTPTATPAPRTSNTRSKGKKVLAVIAVLILFPLLSGVLAVAVFQGFGYSGLDLLSNDPMNLLPGLFGAGVVAGSILMLVLFSVVGLYGCLPMWLRTKTQKGSK